MLLGFLSGAGLAGQLIDVHPTADGAAAFDVVGTTDTAESIITWQDRPLQLMIVADVSVSVVNDPLGPAGQMNAAMTAAYREMRAHPVPGDAFGVTVFAGNARTWIPLGPLDRPGLDAWLAAFRPTEHAPVPWATAALPEAGAWTAEPTAPTDLGLDAFKTDPSTGLRGAIAELKRRPNPLKAVVVLWDGEQTSESPFRRILNRAWKREIHVFTVAVGDIHREGLAARGGGDVYLAPGAADLAMQRILSHLRMPEDGP